MMSWTSFLITIAICSVFLFLPLLRLGMKKMTASKVSATASTAGGAAAAPPPVGSTTATGGAFKALRSPLSWSPLTLYGVILGIMALMLILVPTTWLNTVGDIYQTIALTMILIGLFLFAISSGKRGMVGVMLLAFVFLAFNKPEVTAARVENAKSNGVTTIFKPAPPTPLTPAQLAQRAAIAKQEAEAEKQRVINAAVAQAAAEAEAAKYRPLTTAEFTTRTAGKFEPIQIKSGTQIGPIYAYAACELRWTKTGMGMVRILTRPDSTSKPVEAILTDRGYGIKKAGHDGLVSDLFFEAVQGDIQIELVRLDNGTDTKNPCN